MGLQADAEFKRVIADAERELGLPGSGAPANAAGTPTSGFRRSSLLDRITVTRRGARRSLDGLPASVASAAQARSLFDAATTSPSNAAAQPQHPHPHPHRERHAAEEAAGVSPASVNGVPPGRFALEPLEGASPSASGARAHAARKASAASSQAAAAAAAAATADLSPEMADAAAVTAGQRALMRLIQQRSSQVERLVESTRFTLLTHIQVSEALAAWFGFWLCACARSGVLAVAVCGGERGVLHCSRGDAVLSVLSAMISLRRRWRSGLRLWSARRRHQIPPFRVWRGEMTPFSIAMACCLW